jgi:hypothetical protein
MTKEDGVGTRFWNTAIVVFSLCTAFYILSASMADPDLWGHVLFGQETLKNGGVVRIDPYSYLSGGATWINHEWLAEVAMAAAYQLGGSLGLSLLRFALALVVCFTLHRVMLARDLDPAPAGILLVMLALMLFPTTATVRPQMFTSVFFLATVLLVDAAERRSLHWGWLLPIVTALWINFHGGVLAGLGVIGLWVTVRVVGGLTAGRSRNGLRQMLVPAAIGLTSVATTVLNPYGWRLPAFLVRTATLPRPDISEWQPLQFHRPMSVLFLLLLALGIFALVRSRRKPSAVTLVLFAALGLLPFTAVRHLQLFTLAFPVLVSVHLADLWGDGVRDQPVSPGARVLRPWLAGAILAAGGLFGVAVVNRIDCVEIVPESMGFPVGAVDVLKQTGVSGNLAVQFGWAEYAIWHLEPRIRVAIDGRRETVYPDSIYEEYLNFQNGLRDWDRLIEDRPTDFALVSTEKWPAFNLLSLKPGWDLVYQDSLSALFVRTDHAQAAALRSARIPELPPAGRGLCAP